MRLASRVAAARTLLLIALLGVPAQTPAADSDTRFERRSLAELRRDLDSGRTSSLELTRAYLRRIETIDRAGPKLRAVLSINPDALRQARELDHELRSQGPRGPLHGIPILLKDNIESAERLPTTAGSLALADNITGRDAPIVANLRAAGALILGKTNLSEWANYRSDYAISGWSALGGLTKNPHVLDRGPCGSSSGSAVAVAASLAAASVGGETHGSITCPASMNGIVGLKPTVGLLSGKGIVPIAPSQDAPGPMTTSVADAAVMLTAMVGRVPACNALGCRTQDYAAALSPAALQGKRIGVVRFESGRAPRVEPIYERALGYLRSAGATLVELQLPDVTDINTAEEIVLATEFKIALKDYLATTPPAVRVRNLAQLIQFNKDTAAEMRLFGQDVFELSNATTGRDDPVYQTALAQGKRLAGDEGITRMLNEHKLDLIVAPTTGLASRVDILNGGRSPGPFATLPAVSGYPHLTVPMGEVSGLPVGISFVAAAWSEAQLLAAGFAFERKANARVVPQFKPSLETAEPALDPP